MNRLQDRTDFYICRPIIGIPLFFLIMYAVFSISFSGIGAWLTEIAETFFFRLAEILQVLLSEISVNETAVNLFVGIFKDVTSVLSFLPQTAIFFFLLQLLEECGYMARAVFVTDTLFRRFGLSGNAVIPAIIGCGCTVSAVSASQNTESNERKTLLFSVPFLLCNARFPVLFFLTDAFFPKYKALAALSFYALSVFTFFLSSLISSKGKKAPPLIVKFPDYKMPNVTSLFREVKSKSADYLNRTLTVIFLCAVCFHTAASLTPWFHFTEEETESLLFLFGKIFSFFFVPLGFGKAPFTASLFAGFFAKENLMFALEMLSPKELAALLSFPARVSFTAFSMLYLPCLSTVCAVYKTSGIKTVVYFLIRSLLLVYFTSFILYTLSYIIVIFVET
ncbi:MAG: ferrous iron transporter B [Ruminococcaceae bacterium]|nr:ferrous iron transporter B [Oscillospiraceae bacterium]